MEKYLSSELQTYFGFSEFRPGQEAALTSLLGNKHTLVVMPTGSGKSLIYQLAALRLEGITLVISPLIALMKDQVDQLQRKNIPATFINSALPKVEQNRRLGDVQKGNYRLVYVAPERLRSLSFQKSMSKIKIGLMAVDEAHCISEWGHDFRPDYLNIADSRIAFGKPLTVALTATATPQVQDDILRLLRIDRAEKIVTGFNRPNLTLDVCYATSISEKYEYVRRLVRNLKSKGAIIIYSGTRREAEEITEFLHQVCCQNANFYHAGLSSQEREKVQEAFMSGKGKIVVATNAFGMGIDRADVRQVIHFNLPGSLEAYYQEAGRAGRDGLASVATLIYDPKDRALQEFFIKSSALSYDHLATLFQALPEIGSKPRWLSSEDLSRLTSLTDVQIRLGLSLLERVEAINRLGDEGLVMQLEKHSWDEGKIQEALSKMKAFQDARKKQLEQMIYYAESNQCRRRILLNHFGDRGPADAQDCCDNCRTRKAGLKTKLVSLEHADSLLTKGSLSGEKKASPEVTESEFTHLALMILDTVRRLKFKVGRERIAQILHGSQAEKIKQGQLDQHLYYGRLVSLRQSEIVDLIDQLIRAGYFKLVGGQYPVVHLTPQGEMAIQQRQDIPLNLPKRLRQVERVAALSSQKAGSAVTNRNAERIDQLILDCVKSLPGKLPRSGVAKLLVGSHSERVYAYEDHPQFNALAGLRRNHVMQRVDALIVAGKLIRDEAGKICLSRSDVEMSVEEFLHQSHPRPLPGPWNCGWSLGFHSAFAGSDWQRSPVGEWTYRLKYKQDLSVIPELVAQVMVLVKEHPEILEVDLILPVPPSQQRPDDPVQAFAQALSRETGITVGDALVKTRQTEQQKSFTTLAQKKANVDGAFKLTTSLKGRRILVVDDLFDSGSTLSEIFRVVEKAGAASVHVLTLTRTIHSEK